MKDNLNCGPFITTRYVYDGWMSDLNFVSVTEPPTAYFIDKDTLEDSFSYHKVNVKMKTLTVKDVFPPTATKEEMVKTITSHANKFINGNNYNKILYRKGSDKIQIDAGHISGWTLLQVVSFWMDKGISEEATTKIAFEHRPGLYFYRVQAKANIGFC